MTFNSGGYDDVSMVMMQIWILPTCQEKAFGVDSFIHFNAHKRVIVLKCLGDKYK